MQNWGFIGGAYLGESPVLDGERSYNLFVEQIESGHGKGGAQAYLHGRPGIHLFAILPHTPVRALWGGDNRLFAVGGSKLYEVFPDGGGHVTEIGDVGFDNNPATITSNGNQLLVVSAGQAYVATGNTIINPVQAWGGTFLDGYFIANTPNTNNFRLSGILDGGTWDDADFAVKEGAPDRLLTCLADHELLWLFGRKTIEAWHDTGAAPPAFPFEREPGGFIEQGLEASYTPTKIDGSLMWLGGDDRGAGVIWRAQGYNAQRVSTHAIESEIRKYGTINDAVAYPMSMNGHNFYVINFPTGDTTFVYDTKTGLWHQWAIWVNGTFRGFPGRCHAYTFGKHYVGDYRNGNIYEASFDFTDDSGAPLRYLRSCPHLTNEARWVRHDSLQIDIQVGDPVPDTMRNPDGTYRAPLVSLRFSDDGGRTWSNERMQSAGKIGEYKYRVIFRQLGRSRDRVYEISISDPIRPYIVDAILRVNGQ